MDNWDYKFQHPVIVGRRAAESPLVLISGAAEADADNPDTFKTTATTTSFTAHSVTNAVYSDKKKIILKLATPLAEKPALTWGHLALFGTQTAIAYIALSGFDNLWTARLAIRVTPITSDFDLETDTSWNASAGLTLDTGNTWIIGVDAISEDAATGSKAMAAQLPGDSPLLFTNSQAEGYSIYGYVLEVMPQRVDATPLNSITTIYAQLVLSVDPEGNPQGAFAIKDMDFPLY